ncbi:MAG: thiamine biosynthesis protein ApbE [Bacillota bacterium]|nr:thiamine biosynthesis protein ApbE [Bacillota bacterium]
MIKLRRYVAVMMAVILILIITTSCSIKQNEWISKTELLLGTSCNIKIYGYKDEKIFIKAFNRIREIEDEMTINKSGSEIDEVNAAAGMYAVKVSEDTFYTVKKGLEYSSISKGRYDITVGTLVKLWGIGTEKAKVPSLDEINASKKYINYKDVIMDDNAKTIMLKNKGMIIDLGGIAKGYAADEVAKVLKENGVKHAIINLGGNVLTMDGNPNGDLWRIGVQNPFSEERGVSIGTIEVKDKTVTTAGIYERYLEYNGKKYHHILDIDTGFPVENELVGVTIITASSTEGDGIDTAILLMGLEKGLEFVKSQKDMEAIFVTKDKEIYLTPEIKTNFKLTNKAFTIK